MKWCALTITLISLAACGVDGEPQRPPARVGVGVTPNGVSVGTSVQTGIGSINIGLGNLL